MPLEIDSLRVYSDDFALVSWQKMDSTCSTTAVPTDLYSAERGSPLGSR